MILFVSNRQCFFNCLYTNFIVLFFLFVSQETFVPYRHCKGMGEMRNR